MKAQRRSRGITLLGFQWEWVVKTDPRPLYFGKYNRYSFYRALGGPQGWSRWMWKMSPPLGFDRPAASCRTDRDIPVHNYAPKHK